MVPGGCHSLTMRFWQPFILLTFAIFTVSCATVLSGTKQNIKLNTTVRGALVYVNDRLVDSTPCKVKIARTWQQPAEIRIEKPGYRSVNLELDKKMNELAWLNFINLIGWGIDGASGAMIRYQQPDTITLNLRKKTP